MVLPARMPQLLVNGCDRHRRRHGDQHPAAQPGRGLRGAHRADRRPEARERRTSADTSKARTFRPAARSPTARGSCARSTRRAGAHPRARRVEDRGGRRAAATTIIITSIPYMVNKSEAGRADRRRHHRQEAAACWWTCATSPTDDVRIVLELKKDADAKMVMAYLYKHTPLADRLPRQPDLPGADREPRGRPARCGSICAAILGSSSHFRERGRSRRRVSSSSWRSSSAASTSSKASRRSSTCSTRSSGSSASRMARRTRPQDHRSASSSRRRADRRHPRAEALQAGPAGDQPDPRRAGGEAQARAKEIEAILERQAQVAAKVVRSEITRWRRSSSDKRRTKIGGGGGDEAEFVAEDFIVDEEVTVILSRDGWLKRVREVKDLVGHAAARGRRGAGGHPRVDEGARWRSSPTSAAPTSLRINDVPASTGYGEPVQKLLQLPRRRAGGRRAARSARTSTRPRGRWRWRSARTASACASTWMRTASCRRVPGAASPSRPRVTRWWASRRSSDKDRRLRRHQRRARAALQGRRSQPSWPTPARASSSSRSATATVVLGFGVGAARKEDVIDRRDRRRQGAAGRSRSLLRHRARRQRLTLSSARPRVVRVHRPLAVPPAPLARNWWN